MSTVMVRFDTAGDDLDARLPTVAHLVDEMRRRPGASDDGGRLFVLPVSSTGPTSRRSPTSSAARPTKWSNSIDRRRCYAWPWSGSPRVSRT